MMKKQRIIVLSLTTALSSIVLVGSLAFIRNNPNLFKTIATECTHDSVEHYEANSSHIEHWACCQCHHAWADSGRTIELSSNTSTDRSKIDFGSRYFHAALQSQDSSWQEGGWEWTRDPVVVYDADYTFAYTVSETNLRQVFFESNDTATVLEADKYYGMKVFNNTSTTLDVTVVSREWGGSNTKTVQVEAGQSVFVYGDASLWNDGNKKGAAVRINVHDYSAFSGEVKVTSLKILELSENPDYFDTSYLTYSGEWIWDDTLGFELLNDRIYQKYNYASVTQAFIQSLDTTTTIPEGKYFVSHVVNNTDTALNVTSVSRGWNSAYATQVVPAGESAWVYGDSFVWNYNTNKGGTFRLTCDATSFTGEVLITAPKVVDVPVYAYELTDASWNQVSCTVGYEEDVGFYFSFDNSALWQISSGECFTFRR